MNAKKIKINKNNIMYKDEVYESLLYNRTPEEIYEKVELSSQIMAALEVLTSRESKVLIMRFGLEDGREHTLEEVGKMLGLPAEKIEQIESVALRKLKHPSSREKLEKVVDSFKEDKEEIKEPVEKIIEFPVDLNIVFISTNVCESLIRHFLKHPEEMKTMNRRRFEELIAELFHGFGYEVELTKQTRDGGRDIIAIKDSEVLVKYIIEAKRPKPQKPIGISPVRELYGVKCDEKSTKAILATTTYFTRDAMMYFDRHKWELEPRDYYGIIEWIDDYLKIRGR